MNSVLTFLCLVVGAFIVLALPSMSTGYIGTDYGAITSFFTGKALLVGTLVGVLAGLYAYLQGVHGTFLLRIFICGLLIRLIVVSVILASQGHHFFGGDAVTYDFLGQFQLAAWSGDSYLQKRLKTHHSGVGMGYYVGVVYFFF